MLLFSNTRTVIASAANDVCAKEAIVAGMPHLTLEHVIIRFSALITEKEKKLPLQLVSATTNKQHFGA